MPSANPYAQNLHGVRAQPIDFDATGAPLTKTYHGVSITVDGNIVGRITTWNPNPFTREGAHVFEVNHLTWGKPVDYVPGKGGDWTISCGRTEVWNQEMEIALGWDAVWNDLTDQDRPFSCQEYWYRGRTIYRVWSYSGCWFQDRSEDAIENEGDAIVRTNPTLAFVSRSRTLG